VTFSIAAHDPESGACGVAVSSSSICVAARCAFARAGAGAVASQNVTNPALGLRGLDLLSAGQAADAALRSLLASEAHPAYRQVVVVDTRGGVAVHSGERTLGRQGHATGHHCAAAGNLLADEGVPRAMVGAFAATAGEPLAARLLAALEGGLAAGGEAGNVRSAGVCVAQDEPWPVVDLRVDWDDDPVAALRALWTLYAPQVEDYVTRAHDPLRAPSFGVPGDP
jgi:uncharacterized Ntn-hydrolase superfamily protein